MRHLFHHGERIGRDRRGLFAEPRCYVSVGGGGGASTTHTTTSTSSGANSPVASEGSQAVGSGSIGVGSGKYLEAGATDQAGANLSTNISSGAGSTVTIGDPNATNQISALASQFAQAVGSDASTVQAALSANQGPFGLPWSTIGIGGAVLLAIVFLVSFLRKSK